ncbi:MAG: hypothetical protein VX915_02330 [Pseudomonadota bacterium]|nr:hypothetical protein [Pseudomonadota bacterium]
MTVSALDFSDPDNLLADINKELLGTGSQVNLEQLFYYRRNELKRTTAYIRYDFALQNSEELYGEKPHCD